MLKALQVALPQAWRQRASWLILLWPLAWLYGALFYLNRNLYRLGFKSVYRAPIPVWVIGNLTAGGNGKTPLIAALAQQLQARGLNVVIMARGYGGKGPFPRWVQASDTVAQVGDEPLMLAQQGFSVVVSPNRQHAIEHILAQAPQTQLILADDGLQHHALAHDVGWIVRDAQLGYGNGWLLPAGPLRQCSSDFAGYPIVELQADADIAQRMSQPAFWLTADAWQPILSDQYNETPPQPGERVDAVAGIGRPERFFNLLTEMGYRVTPYPFPDHYQYDVSDMPSGKLVTTAKDAVKWRALEVPGWFLPVTAQLNGPAQALVEHTLQQLKLATESRLDDHQDANRNQH